MHLMSWICHPELATLEPPEPICIGIVVEGAAKSACACVNVMRVHGRGRGRRCDSPLHIFGQCWVLCEHGDVVNGGGLAGPSARIALEDRDEPRHSLAGESEQAE